MRTRYSPRASSSASDGAAAAAAKTSPDAAGTGVAWVQAADETATTRARQTRERMTISALGDATGYAGSGADRPAVVACSAAFGHNARPHTRIEIDVAQEDRRPPI